MKTKHSLQSIALVVILLFTFTNCQNEDELIDELQISREFAPVDLSSQIRTQTSIELTWQTEDDVSLYFVEISENADFSNPAVATQVNSSDLPVLFELSQETLYYIRVKAIAQEV